MNEYYPMIWAKYFKVTAVENGNLTSQAQLWFNELQSFDEITVFDTMKKLKSEFDTFPPNAMQFAKLCGSSGFDEVLDEILDYIDSSDLDDFWWTNQLAFNVYSAMKYSKVEGIDNMELVKRAKRAFNQIDRTALIPIPPKPVALLPEPEKDEDWNKKKRRFHCALMNAIYRYNPDLFLCKETTKEINRDPVNKLPVLMRKLFNSNNAHGLIQKFIEVTGFKTKPPEKALNDENKTEWNKYRESLDSAMDRFVLDGGILK